MNTNHLDLSEQWSAYVCQIRRAERLAGRTNDALRIVLHLARQLREANQGLSIEIDLDFALLTEVLAELELAVHS
jgi:hypothetical protein